MSHQVMNSMLGVGHKIISRGPSFRAGYIGVMAVNGKN